MKVRLVRRSEGLEFCICMLKMMKGEFPDDFEKKGGVDKKEKNPCCARVFRSMETSGIEPLTFWLPAKRSPS